MKVPATKPYLIRAVYEWCIDNELTAYISVDFDRNTLVPEEYVRDGEITLDISPLAACDLLIDNEVVQFTARFNGISRRISIPVGAIKAIFSKEINQGLFFSPEIEENAPRTFKNEDTNCLGSTSNNYLAHEDRGDRVHLKIVR